MIFVITVELWFRTVVNPHQLGKYITKQTNNITKGKRHEKIHNLGKHIGINGLRDIP